MDYQFELVGIMPLIMHADDIEAGERLQAWRKNPQNKRNSEAGTDWSPAWTWHTYLYTDGKHIAMPQANIAVAIRGGAAQIVMKKQKTFKEASQSSLMIGAEYCDFFCGGRIEFGKDGKRVHIDKHQVPVSFLEEIHDLPRAEQVELCAEKGIDLWAKRAKVGMSKHVRVRPRFKSWSVRGIITVFEDALISRDTLQQFLDLAGRSGLCDWRPSSPKSCGPFGTFQARII